MVSESSPFLIDFKGLIIYNHHMKKSKNNQKDIKSKFLSVVIILLMLSFFIFLFCSSIFNLEKVEISGNLKLKNEEIKKESRLVDNKNIFLQNLLLAKRNLLKNPRIFKVNIKRKLPNIIEVKIVERRELYEISKPEGYYILDNQGFVLRKENVKQNLITLKGIEENLAVNRRISESNFIKLEEINKIYDMAVSLNFDTVISGINVEDIKNRNINIEMDGENKVAYMKTGSDIRKNMLMIKEILSYEKEKKGDIIIPENNPIYFREKN